MFDNLTDDALIAQTQRVAEAERRSTADLLELLNEVERRRLHLALGHSSLFAFCTRVLALSEQAAYSRITAARAARRFPVLISRLASGALTLSSVGILAPHLSDENVDALIEAADGRSTRDVERLIATLHPQPDVAASVRKLPRTMPDNLVSTGPALPELVVTPEKAPTPTVPVPARPLRAVIAPLAPTRYLLRATIGEEAHAALTRLRALLRHRIPDGDPAAIVSCALAALLAQTERTKLGAVDRPRPQPERRTSGRHIPAAVRRAVWHRDQGRCAFVGSDRRCDETAFLEVHHVVPFAAGGPTDVTNLELRCRAHNAYEAAIAFGPNHDLDLPTRP